jgi:hypothetical protein
MGPARVTEASGATYTHPPLLVAEELFKKALSTRTTDELRYDTYRATIPEKRNAIDENTT